MTAGKHAPPSLLVTMRAWTHSRAGPPFKVLSLTPDIKKPTIKSSTDVLVRISHAAFNPGGSIMMQLCPALFRSMPAIPELDFSGTIVAAGSAVPESRNLVAGTTVFGSVLVGPHLRAGAGALAEYVVVAAESVVRKPGNVSFEEAAGLSVAGSTALLLAEKAGLKRGDSVLINGASGGIGTMVVQMAREAVGQSGRVVAVCSGRNVELAEKLGADEVIDYLAHAPVHDYLATRFSRNRFSAVIDAFGIQDLYTHCEDYLSPGKPFVTVGVMFKEYSVSSLLYATCLMLKNRLCPYVLGGGSREYICVEGFTDLAAMERLGHLVEDGKLRVVIDSCWDMEDALKAYEKVLSMRARGKVIVKVQDL